MTTSLTAVELELLAQLLHDGAEVQRVASQILTRGYDQTEILSGGNLRDVLTEKLANLQCVLALMMSNHSIDQALFQKDVNEGVTAIVRNVLGHPSPALEKSLQEPPKTFKPYLAHSTD